jgi:hypothetical protein
VFYHGDTEARRRGERVCVNFYLEISRVEISTKVDKERRKRRTMGRGGMEGWSIGVMDF